MQKPKWLNTLRQRRLFWVAIGAFASTAAMLLTQGFVTTSRSQSEVLIIRAKYDNKDTINQIIAAAGDCVGKFNVESASHAYAYAVQIPTKNLSRDDYECLLRAGPIGENVGSKDGNASMHGEDWEGADWQISNSN